LIKEVFREDWPDLERFIAEAWGADHPLRDKELFFWQHSGPGLLPDAAIATAAVANEKIVGLRGLQHFSFQIYDKNNRLHIVGGCAAPFMHVLKAHRGLLGLKLYRHNISRFPINLYLGANKLTSLRLHHASGYRIFDHLPRYGLELSSRVIEHFPDVIDQEVQPHLLGGIWSKFSSVYRPFSVLRTPDFFRWRYQEAPFWSYRMLLSSNRAAAAVYRTEPVTSEGKKMGVALRLIELFYDPELCSDGQLRKFLRQIVSFAVVNGCEYVDHFQTMHVLQTALLDAGFIAIEPESSFFPILFNPLDYEKPPINYGWKLSNALSESMEDPSHAHYVVKSDSDQDRPVPPV